MNRFTLPNYLTIVLAGLCAAPALAATPRDELLRLVPDDVGVCLIVQDLRGHTAAIEASPFAQQVRTSFVGKLLVVAPETKKLQEASKVLKEQFGTDWAQLRDDILGDAVVMTYTPGPPGEPDKEQGLFMVRARDAALLQKLIDKLNDAQKKSGDLKSLDEAMHNGVKYFKRVEKNQPAHWYLVRGPVLAYSA